MSQPPRRILRATTITADAGRIVGLDAGGLIVGLSAGRIVCPDKGGRIVSPDAAGRIVSPDARRIVGPLSGLRHARESVLRRDGRFLAAGADAASAAGRIVCPFRSGRIVCPFSSGRIVRPHAAAAR